MASMAAPDTRPRRLPPTERKAQILLAARRVLARDGVDGFSLEEVAREAGVAATLPRHYFDSRDGLLAAAALETAREVTEPLIAPGLTLPERLRIYISRLAENSWGHALWVNSGYLHPLVDETLRKLRCAMIEGAYQRRWDHMTPHEQLTNSGLIGYFNDVVTAWIDQGAKDQELVVSALLDGARRLGVQNT